MLKEDSILSTELSRRLFLKRAGQTTAATLAVGALAAPGSLKAQARPVPALQVKDDLPFTSALKMAAMIREKKISAKELLQIHLDRIAAVNPQLNAVVLMAEERAMIEAEEADRLTARGISRGPLHGVPFTIKDSFDTVGLVSTGGTMGRRDFIPGRDATVVARLREAGGILMGKTNTPEFTLSGITDNLIHGKTINPYKANHSPGGSSGGAGAIVAAGGAPFDIGTDFGGSIRGPSHLCGIAGIKPTSFRAPRTGHIVDYGGIFDSYQQPGPMARYVEDLYLILKIISGPDKYDAGIIPMPLYDPANVDFRSLRVAWFVNNGSETEPTPETADAIAAAISAIAPRVRTIREDCPTELLFELESARRDLSQADGRAWVRRLVEKFGTTVTAPNLNTGDGEEVSADEFTHIVERLDSAKSKLLSWFKDYDLVICPVMPRPAPEYNDDMYLRRPPNPANVSFMGSFNTTGWPGAVCRAGTSPDGLPIGVQFLAQPWREDIAIAAAAVVEAQTGGWKMPPL
jgi:amidase